MAIKLKTILKNLQEESLISLIQQINTSLDPTVSYQVYFVDKKPFRTLKQNSYLWGVVYSTISRHTGYDLHEVHEMCKSKFGVRTKFCLDEKDTIEYMMSTRMMSTSQMTDYIDAIRSWSKDKIDLYIPAPNEISIEDIIYSNQF